MSTAPNAVQPARQKTGRRLRNFWARVTEGREIAQLWGQLKSEARESYSLYSKEVDWESIGRQKKRWKRPFLAAWALFQAMLMKLSPARRVVLLLAVFLLLFQPHIETSKGQGSLDLAWLGALLLFVLLALELADRVTMKRDLEIAREIQQWLVPERPPVVSGLDIAFATRPQNTVAGDYYDAFLRPSPSGDSSTGALLLAVADVAGKSVPAAILMATFQASLRALAVTPVSLNEIVAGLERYARAHSLEGLRFTTAFLAEIPAGSRAMQYVNAGHNDPILRRASGKVERLGTGGPPFGLPVFTDHEIPYLMGSIQLQPGDLLFVFTDGLVEAVNEDGVEYGESRLLACLSPGARESAADTLKRVMANVNSFVGYTRQHDDITCLVLLVNS